MTREEIEELKGLAASIGFYDDKNPCKRAVILGKAIQELEQELCEDTISRQAVLAIAGDSCLDLNNYDDTKEFCDEIKELPSVAPYQKIGYWIRVDKNKLKCSECEVVHLIAQYPQSAKIDYCPNCGTKMQEVEE